MIEVAVKKQRQGFCLDVSLDMGDGVTALFGASGSGKSTLLNLITGLEKPDSGRIVMNDHVLFDSATGINVPVHRRRIGYVFQDSLLFPHLSVRQNLLYGFQPGHLEFPAVTRFLGLENFLERRPASLSGGERQRVAIGRALLSSPQLLLMDEPLANLDMDRKREIIPYIEEVQETFRIPVIYVSHAIEEVSRLASTVIAISHGRVTTDASRFERSSILNAQAVAFDAEYGLTTLHHPAGKISLAAHLPIMDHASRIVVRATDVTLALTPPKNISARTILKGIISRCEVDDGPTAFVQVQLTGGEMLAASLTRKALHELDLVPGKRVLCLLKSVSIDERWLASG